MYTADTSTKGGVIVTEELQHVCSKQFKIKYVFYEFWAYKQ